MEKSDIKLYFFYVFQIPLAFFMSFIHDCIIKLPYLPNPQTLSGVFLVFLVISIVIVIPFIILMRKNKYLKENHLGFAVMFFCMAFILNYYGKMEFDKDPRPFNFIQVLYFIMSTSNIIVYFLIDSILKQVEKRKFRQQNTDHIKNQDDKDIKIIESDQAEVKTNTENVQNELKTARNAQETILSEQKNKEELFYLGAIVFFSAIWILNFRFISYKFINTGFFLFSYFVGATFSPALITLIYHRSEILKKYNFNLLLYIVNIIFLLFAIPIGEGLFLPEFFASAICIILAFELHDRYKESDTDKICIAIIGMNIIFSFVLLFN